jgi:hypothetical protein
MARLGKKNTRALCIGMTVLEKYIFRLLPHAYRIHYVVHRSRCIALQHASCSATCLLIRVHSSVSFRLSF